MNNEIIKIIETKRNKLRRRIIVKGIFASKKEKEILNKYEKLLMEQYVKYIDYYYYVQNKK